MTIILTVSRYQVAVTPLRGGQPIAEASYSSYIYRPNYGQHALSIISTILLVIVISGIILTVYKRWQQVRERETLPP